MIEFDSDNWQKEVLDSEIPVLVDFWAPWCPPCRQMLPLIQRIAEKYEGKIKVGKVNVDDNQDLSAQYHVNSIPKFILFSNGEGQWSAVGLVGEDELTKVIGMMLGISTGTGDHSSGATGNSI